MKKRKIKGSDVVLSIGALFIVTALIWAAVWLITQNSMAKSSEKTVELLKSAMPKTYSAAPDDRTNVKMPAYEVEGKSFCGILEIPRFDRTLPLQEIWKTSKLAASPCIYSGNIYEGSLIIGGSQNKRQLDFMKTISNDDNIFITDMTGGKYSYTVTAIYRTDDVSTEHLSSFKADLVLFSKNNYAFDYTVVICEFVK